MFHRSREVVKRGRDLDCAQMSGAAIRRRGARAARAGSRDRLLGAARAGSERCPAECRAPTRWLESGVRALSRASMHRAAR